MEEEAMMQVYYPDTRIYKRIMYLVSIKQNGLCQSCRKPLTGDEPVVRSDTRTARYYHFNCAERRRIDDDKPIKTFFAAENKHNNIYF